jgi:hypothetical protein
MQALHAALQAEPIEGVEVDHAAAFRPDAVAPMGRSR